MVGKEKYVVFLINIGNMLSGLKAKKEDPRTSEVTI